MQRWALLDPNNITTRGWMIRSRLGACCSTGAGMKLSLGRDESDAGETENSSIGAAQFVEWYIIGVLKVGSGLTQR